MRETIVKLLNSNITGYKISQKTGVGESLVSNLRKGKRDLDNLSLKNAERLYEFQKEMETVKELNNKIIDNIVVGEVILLDNIDSYFIDIETADDFNVEFVTLNEIEYEEKVLFEIETHKTYEVEYKDEVTADNISELHDAWLSKDQEGETYIESFFFEHKEDAKQYITKVLKGYPSFEECAKNIGVIE